MKFTEHTTSEEIVTAFKDSVLDLMDKVVDTYDKTQQSDGDERLQAVRTKKLINKWFYENGNL